VNLLAAIVLVVVIILVFIQLLGYITKHGQYLTVPSVIGQTTDKAITFLESKGFEVVIQDSVFIDSAKRGVVLKQLPDPNSTVKINRTVFLTVNRVTVPLIDMPALEGKTLSFALEILRRSHLQLGDTVYKADFMKGSVLEQSYRGSKIQSGAKVPWGSSIDLVIGSGLTDERIAVPSLLGLTLAEARVVLEENGIGVGAVIPDPDVTDPASAFVYRQSPPKLDEDDMPVYIRSGQLMDIWISATMKVIDSTSVQQ
jgi:beta-lactam-binding protein with PASTA domain